MATLHIGQIFRASFVSLALLACENGGGDDSTDTGNTSGVTTGPGTEATTSVTTGEPTTTTTPTTGTADTGTADTGTADTGTDDTGPDETGDTGPDETGTEDTGPDETGPDETGTAETGTADTGTADTGTGTTGLAGLSFAVDVYAPIIEPKCGCHVEGSGGLTLGNDAATAFAAIVGVPSKDVPDMSLVEAGNSQTSYLFHKVADTHLGVGGEGSKMPLGGQLDPGEIATIAQWIDEGALP